MKLRLDFKCPDVVDYAVEDMPEPIDEYELTKLKLSLAKWIKYSECVTLEYDSETNSIRVCEV